MGIPYNSTRCKLPTDYSKSSEDLLFSSEKGIQALRHDSFKTVSSTAEISEHHLAFPSRIGPRTLPLFHVTFLRLDYINSSPLSFLSISPLSISPLSFSPFSVYRPSLPLTTLALLENEIFFSVPDKHDLLLCEELGKRTRIISEVGARRQEGRKAGRWMDRPRPTTHPPTAAAVCCAPVANE